MTMLQNNVDYNNKVLEVKNLKKHFKHGVGKNKLIVPAVDGLTFDIYKREVFGLVGESGCGKTTTGRTIIKLLNPTEGTAKLNGEVIVAGYLEYVEEIKKVKEEAKQKIENLDPYESELSQINKNLDERLLILNSDIEKLQKDQKEALLQAKKPKREYKEQKYNIKSQYNFDVEKINYNFHLEYTNLIKKTVNQAAVEHAREIAGAKVGYERKLQGLKDSAALRKEVIKRRIVELTEQYKEIYANIDAKFEPLIAENASNIMPKEEAKAKIKELKEKRDALVKERKAKYHKEIETLKQPSSIEIAKNVAKVNRDYQAKINAMKKQIIEAKNKAKTEIANLDKTIKLDYKDEKVKQQIKEIKDWENEKISLLKRKISEAKRANKSPEALEASQKMQMIFQDPISSLNPRMTVQEIVGEGLTILGKHTKEEIKEKVGEVLELVGLSREYVTRYPHEFSGGQRQRIGVARALILDPDFIIADEPISALDVSIRAQVINLLSELKERLGLTILFIAHDLSVVRFFCDRIAVMYYGKIVELATSQELFKNPMHPYTRSLLSSIPQPDPDYEKNRKRIDYNPAMHDYRIDKPSLRELAPGHLIYANDKEFAELKEEYNKITSSSKKVKVK